jgi:hypothetical protein
MSKINHEQLDYLIRFIKTPAWKELKQALIEHKERGAVALLSQDLSDTNALAFETSRLKGFGECIQWIETLINLEEKKQRG